jgi:predicted transcriptional regulator of viral defense system
MPAKQRGKGHTVPLESLVARNLGKYVEMPGLRVTLAQACRLLQVDTATCQKLLDHLVREGFLYRTDSGFYVASQDTRRRK